MISLATAAVSIGLLVAVFLLLLDVAANDKLTIQCQAQAHAQLVTEWALTDAADTAARLALMYERSAFDSLSALDQSGSYVTGTMLNVMMGMTNTSMPFLGSSGAVFAIWRQVISHSLSPLLGTAH